MCTRLFPNVAFDRTKTFSTANIQAHDDSYPHDLLMISTIEEIQRPEEMIGFEEPRTLCVIDRNCECIWKIDIDTYQVKKWLSEVDDGINLSVASNYYTGS